MIMILVMTLSFKFRKLHGDNEFDGALFNVDEHCNCRHAKLFLDSNSILSIWWCGVGTITHNQRCIQW